MSNTITQDTLSHDEVAIIALVEIATNHDGPGRCTPEQRIAAADRILTHSLERARFELTEVQALADIDHNDEVVSTYERAMAKYVKAMGKYTKSLKGKKL